jgi:hypothetical protein
MTPDRGKSIGMSQEIRRRIAARTTGGLRPDELAIPRYSEGIEQLEDDVERLHVGRFSDGQETLPEGAPGKEHVGRYSEGLEHEPVDAHVGRFSDGALYQPAA